MGPDWPHESGRRINMSTCTSEHQCHANQACRITVPFNHDSITAFNLNAAPIVRREAPPQA
eukprot:scaffold507929_cov18-Prasinocladus_malaysianus.AAC.1